MAKRLKVKSSMAVVCGRYKRGEIADTLTLHQDLSPRFKA